MSLLHILVFIPLALAMGSLSKREWRKAGLLVSSLLALYWLQPATPIRNLDFWLPTASLSLTLMVWAVTLKPNSLNKDNTRLPALLILITFFVVGITRYAGPWCCLTPTRPPELWKLASYTFLLAGLLYLLIVSKPLARLGLGCTILCLISLFIVLKNAPLNLVAGSWLRKLSGQPTENASLLDIPWLGFSYLAFRLLHVLQDYRQRRTSAYKLDDFVIYALFFPSLTAGPIDRAQRFIQELNEEDEAPAKIDGHAANAIEIEKAPQRASLFRFNPRIITGGQRLIIGLFKKFALADTLAIIALNAQNATQVTSTIWAWVLLYAYALRIYFDFSGYTDVAIGLGTLMGITLPENFQKPYQQTNLTAFWNSWHITLAQWFRAYFFNPLTRALRSRSSWLPTWLIILVAQLSTMVLIGLWHGISWSFAIWGLWHGSGLFMHNRWLALARTQRWEEKMPPRIKEATSFLGWLITFNYVTLGWVWFVFPNPNTAIRFMATLMGR